MHDGGGDDGRMALLSKYDTPMTHISTLVHVWAWRVM